MTSDRDLPSVLHDWLHEDAHEYGDRVLDQVVDLLDVTPQRQASRLARRFPIMNNNFVRYGMAAAAVTLVAIFGYQLIGGPTLGGPGPSPSTAVEPSPSLPTAGSPMERAFLWFDPTLAFEPRTDLPWVTVTIPTSGWACPTKGYQACVLNKGGQLDGLAVPDGQLPESALLMFATTAGIHVYQDPCQWSYDLPDPPLTTAHDIAAALAGQPGRNASGPVDLSVGGYPATSVTVRVPVDLAYDADGFTDCFRGVYASWTFGGHYPDGYLPVRWHQAPGQIDTFWIIEVDGSIVIIDAMSRADTPADRIQQLRAIAESAMFEARISRP